MPPDFKLDRETMAKHHVHMKVDVAFAFDQDTPEDVKFEIGVLASALSETARRIVDLELSHQLLTPQRKREVLYGEELTSTGRKGLRILRDSAWLEAS